GHPEVLPAPEPGGYPLRGQPRAVLLPLLEGCIEAHRVADRGPVRAGQRPLTPPLAMKIAVAGAHGQIARLLIRRLVAAGDEAVGLIRNPEHSQDVAGDGAAPVHCDLEQVSED